MNVIDYIKKYGNKTLDIEPLNDGDKLLFGLLSYVYYNGTVSANSYNKRTIHDVAEEFFTINSKKDNKKNIMAIRSGIKLLYLIKDMPRYKDLLLYNDIYKGDDSKQFSALCIEINPKLVYVSFEGTDQLISGWEEDFAMSYEFPIPSQKDAIRYLNKHFTFGCKKIILGGHSKGGNLALIAGMYSNFWVRRKIVNIYSFDGPGLREKQFISRRYKKISDRLISVIPNNSLVGILLRHTNNFVVVKSTGVGIMSHFAETWQFDDKEFKKVKLSGASKIVDSGIITWLDIYSDEDREMFTKELFKMFRDNDVTSLLQIIDNPKLLLNMLKESSNLDLRVSDMIKELVDILLDYSKKSIFFFLKK